MKKDLKRGHICDLFKYYSLLLSFYKNKQYELQPWN